MSINAIYAQSGGATSVINASASGVINAWREHNSGGKLYAAQNGIYGLLNEDLIDTTFESNEDVQKLKKTPGCAFGSCRYKLHNLTDNRKEHERLIEIFSSYNIQYFLYNGGNDSADTCLKVAQIAKELSYPIIVVHIPKTIDNDLVITDNCPGYGSVAKYIATSITETGLDIASMYTTSTKVFILEVMGRNTGWIAASSGLASLNDALPPHIILFPEITFNENNFLTKVEDAISKYGYCAITVSEGIRDKNNQLISTSNLLDPFGHEKLGGVGYRISQLITEKLNIKSHYAISDYLQRSARHIASLTDVSQAYAVGYTAVEYALDGKHSVMPYIDRVSEDPYTWQIRSANLTEIANKEKLLPKKFINNEGFHITEECKKYIQPLIIGEDYPVFINGVPDYARLKNNKVTKKLNPFIFNNV